MRWSCLSMPPRIRLGGSSTGPSIADRLATSNITLLQRIEKAVAKGITYYCNVEDGKPVSNRMKKNRELYRFLDLTPTIRLAASTEDQLREALVILAPDVPEAARYLGIDVPTNNTSNTSTSNTSTFNTSTSNTSTGGAVTSSLAGPSNSAGIMEEMLDNTTDILSVLSTNSSSPEKDIALQSGLSAIPIEGYTLLPHQRGIINAVLALRQRRNVFNLSGVLLALDMGLGKTLMSLVIALATRNMGSAQNQVSGHSLDSAQSHRSGQSQGSPPILVVVTKSLITVWKDAIKKFFDPSFQDSVLYLHKDYLAGIEALDREFLFKHQIVITTYDFVKGAFKNVGYSRKPDYREIVLASNQDNPATVGYEILFHTTFSSVIFDEAHNISTPKTAAFEACMRISRRYAILLSGTPIRNTDKDLWTLMRLLGYSVMRKNINEVSPYIFNMTYDQAQISLPEKKVIVTILEPDEKEVEFHQALKDAANGLLRDESSSFIHLLAMINMLRQSMNACATVKFDGAPDRSWQMDPYGTAGMHSTKINAVIDIVSGLKKREKVLIFSSFLETLELISHRLEDAGFKKGSRTFIINGQVDTAERESIIHKFRTTKKRAILLISKTIGSDGFDFQFAPHVILVEPWWCPSVDDQCIARSHRIGQNKPVTVHHLYIRDSIEDYVRKVTTTKRDMIANLFGEVKKERNNPNREMITEMLQYI